MQDRCLESIESLVKKVLKENDHQLYKWGVQSHTPEEWYVITAEEFGEVAKAIQEYKYRGGKIEDVIKELIQASTLMLKMTEMYIYEAREIKEVAKHGSGQKVGDY
jgi:NTP pyrophosphatase (non-canonical NTP hydrolase)